MVRFEYIDASDPSQTPLETLQVGQEFLVRTYVRDNRASQATGVLQAYFDVSYESDLVSINGPITHEGSEYSLNADFADTSTDGWVRDAGGLDQDRIPPGNRGAEFFLFSMPFHVDTQQPNTLDLGAQLSEFTPRATLFFSDPTAVQLGDIEFINTFIAITQPVNPQVSIAATTNGNEAGAVGGVFTVTQTAITSSDTVISYTVGGTATPGSDYTVLSGSVRIPAGNTTATINVPVINDAKVEGNETVAVSLDTITSGSPSVTIDTANRQATLQIADNDSAGIQITGISGSETTESGGTVTFGIVLTSEPTANVTIGLSSTDTSEGTVSPSSVTFTPTNWNQAQTVTVTGQDDGQADGHIAYRIETAPAVSGDANYNSRNADDVLLTNRDNDAIGITVQPTSGQTTEAGGTASFQIVLSSQPTADVTIGLLSSDTTEGTVSPASVTFTSANWNIPQTIVATGQDDPVADGNITYTIVTAAASSSDSQYHGFPVSDVSVTNLDNDAVGITVQPTTGQTTETGGTTSFQIQLASQPTANVTIDLSSSDTNEGTVSTSSVTFTPLDWNLARLITVTGQDDDVADGNVAYTIVTSAATSSDPGYNGRSVPDVSITNLDNDAVGITVAPTTGQTTEAGGTAGFAITLSSRPAADVTIALSSTDTSEGTLSTESVTFTPDTWNVSRNVTVTGQDDDEADGNMAYTIVTAPAVSSDLSYHGRNAADVAMTNLDNDAIGITVQPTVGQTTEAGGTASFTVVLSSRPTADVTIGLSSSDPAEGTVSPGAVTFLPTTWNVPQTVTVTGQDDARADGNRPYTIVTAPATSTDPSYAGRNAADVSMTNQDNDSAGILITASGTSETTESGGTCEFRIVLTSQPTADVVIDLSSSDAGEGTVSPSSVRFTPDNWNDQQAVTVTGADDPQDDGDMVYTVVTAPAASSDSSYSGRDADNPTVTNRDNDQAGFVIAVLGPLTTSESGQSTSFSVVLLSQPTAEVTVDVTSSDPSEGNPQPAALTFDATNWNAPQTVTIAGADDHDIDGDVEYRIVTGARSSDPKYDRVGSDELRLTNTDNDVAGISVSPVAGLGTSEAGATATFEVVLDTRPTADVTVEIVSSDPSEGTTSVDHLTFTAENWSSPRIVTINPVDDPIDDGDIAYSIEIRPATSSDTDYAGFDPADVAVTNLDNDQAGFAILPTADLSTTEAGATAEFTVVLTSQPSADVTIEVSSTDLTEGTVNPAELVFTAANWNEPQKVTVTGQDDELTDGDVVYSIVLSAAGSDDPNYDGRDPGDVNVTNADNDIPGFVLLHASGLFTDEAGLTASFEIALKTAPSAPVTLDLSSSNSGEGTVSPGQLVFTPENWATPQSVTVTGMDDVRADGNIVYQIVTAAATSEDANYHGIDPQDASVTNRDNDVAGIHVTPTAGRTTSEAGGSADFEVRLTSEPVAAVEVGLVSSKPGEGTASPGSLTFTSANWNQPQTVRVTGVDDAVDDDDAIYLVTASVTGSDDAGYRNVAAQSVEFTNTDNDTAGVIVSRTSGLVTSEQGDEAEFTIVLASRPTGAVEIRLSSSDPREGTVSPSQVVFTEANWNEPQTITVTGSDDYAADGDRSYSIITSPALSADPKYGDRAVEDVAVTNRDDDVPGITITPRSGLETTEAGGTATFEVKLDTEPFSDVEITVTSSDPTEGTVDPAVLRFSPTTWSVAQTVTVRGTDDSLTDGRVGYTVLVEVAASDDAAYRELDGTSVEVANRDDDVPGIRLTAGEDAATGEAGRTAALSVVLKAQPETDVIVQLASSDETEGSLLTQTLTFTPANWNTPQTVTAAGVNDDAVDGNVDYTITATATSSDPNYTGLAPVELALTNEDDDSAELTIQAVETEVFEGTGGTSAQVTFEVKLSGAVQGGFSVAYAVSDGTATLAGGDYVDNDGAIAFAGTDSESHLVTVAVNPDNILEADETFRAALAGLSNIGPGAAARINVASEPLEFAILDDEEFTVSLTAVSLPEGTGSARTTFSFEVTISNPVQGGLQIRYTTNDGTATLAGGDYIDNDGVLSFSGETAETKTIQVEVVQDAKVERDETFVVTLEEIIFLDPALAEVISAEGGSRTGRIVNDDQATVSFAASSSLAVETAGSHSVDVRLSVAGGGTLSEDVTVAVAAVAGSTAVSPADYAIGNPTVTFAAGSADGATRAVAINLVPDGLAEGQEVVRLGLAIGGDALGGQVTVISPEQHDVLINEDVLTGSIAGTVWYDANNNGKREAGETLIPGVTVVLSGTSAGGETVEIDSMTDSAGAYRFDELPAGTYTVREIQPKAFLDGIDVVGTIGGNQSGTLHDDALTDIVLAAGQQGVGYDFGERALVNSPVSPRRFLASAYSLEQSIREVVAKAEEAAGETARAAAIRRGEAATMRRIGSQVEFIGTSQNDEFKFVPAGGTQSTSAEKHLVVANGIRWEFGEDVRSIAVNGSGGSDRIELYDSPASDLLEASGGMAALSNNDFRLEAIAFELVRAICSLGGTDKVEKEAVDYILELEGPWIEELPGG
ncbi:MAG: hypothetical protein HUU20_01830 [Pirellulales bacterium]|nr:hypothetical protein [Pirellulales bacterium]